MKLTSLLNPRMLIAYLILIALPTVVQAEAVNGSIKNILGNATITLPGGKTEKVVQNMPVPPKSVIVTSADSKVIVQWMPGALSVIGPNSTVTVGSLAYSSAGGQPNRKIGINLAKGTLFNHLNHNDGVSDFSIRTPKGVAAARGTDWEVFVNGKDIGVGVVSSAVDFTGNGGYKVVIKAGYLWSYTDGNGVEVPLTQDQIDLIIYELRLAGIGVQSPIAGQPNDLNVQGTLRESPLPASSFGPPASSEGNPIITNTPPR